MKVSKLVTLAVAVVGLFFIVFSTINTSVASSKAVSAKEAFSLITDNKGKESFVILDIRTPDEFSQGHIENAINIDFLSPDFKNKISELNRDKTYLMHCKSGGRSGKSLAVFEELKFKNIVHMNGGYSEWAAANLPTIK